jgi:predicted metal-dependent hydrolase
MKTDRKRTDDADEAQLLWDHLFESHPAAPLPSAPAPNSVPREKPVLNLESIYRDAYREILGRVPPSIREFRFVFYPYRDVRAKVEFQGGILTVRLARVLEDMSEDKHRALSLILVGKLERRPYPKEAERRFDAYARSEVVRQRVAEQEKARPPRRKPHYGVQGLRHNLLEVFDRINQEYFEGKLKQPPLSWTRTASRKRLGYVDGKGRVYLSRVLDRLSTPCYAMDFIMYHELLHLVIPSEKKGRRTYHHTRAFREAEKRFRYYSKARKWMGHDVD